MKRVLAMGSGVILTLVVLAASAHAAVGAEGHEAGQCLTCAMCEWVHDLVH